MTGTVCSDQSIVNMVLADKMQYYIFNPQSECHSSYWKLPLSLILCRLLKEENDVEGVQ